MPHTIQLNSPGRKPPKVAKFKGRVKIDTDDLTSIFFHLKNNTSPPDYFTILPSLVVALNVNTSTGEEHKTVNCGTETAAD